MIRPIITLAVDIEADIVNARQRTRRISELLGFDTQDQTRVATAVSEIVRNAFTHGGGGKVEVAIDDNGGRPYLFIKVSDNGPGIGDLDAILEGRYLSSRGSGRGLTGAKRLVDTFTITSVMRQGTVVELRKRLPKASAPVTTNTLAHVTGALAREKNDDPLTALRDQNRELLLSLEQFTREFDDTNRGVVALHAELDQRAEQLKQASDLKSRFLSNVTHELRTPLNSILALSRLLSDQLDGPLTAEQQKQVTLIRRSAENLLEIVNDLLDLAKVEAGRMEVRCSQFSIDEVFAGLRALLRPLNEQNPVDLLFSEESPLPKLLTDEAKVTQILRNLVSNALKYTESGHISVVASLDEINGQIRVRVTDTGIGIALEHQSLIFEEFTQVQNRLQVKQKGTGLGLPLSRQLARLLGGDITLESQTGHGSTFTLTIPLRYLPGGAAACAEASTRKRILVVDDDQTFRYVLRQWIAGSGAYDIVEASNGEEALGLISEKAPDLIILDLAMPVLDGFAVMDSLAADHSAPSLPTVVVTSASLELQDKFPYRGVQAVISKSNLSREAILAALQNANVQSVPHE